jgi:hypothetical protein
MTVAACLLFVVRPHPDDFDRLYVIKHLIDKAMLYADSLGIGTGEISDEFFKARRILVRVFAEDVQ